MRAVYVVILLLALALASQGDTEARHAVADVSDTQACLDAASADPTLAPIAQGASCCAGHRGVCGCRAGRIVCCDRTFDARCRCNLDGPSPTS
jgi:hypothetical protein